MGKRQKLRKKIAGQERVVDEHRRKIEEEMKKPRPNLRAIEKWLKDIRRAEEKIRQLKRRLLP